MLGDDVQNWCGQIDKDLEAVASMLNGIVNVAATMDWRLSMQAQHVLGAVSIVRIAVYAAHMSNNTKQYLNTMFDCKE